MVKLYYPPQALLPVGTKEFVELAGAKCILAMDEDRQFVVVTDLWQEVSWGEFWKERAISDQIEKITIKKDDSEAIYNPNVMQDRISAAFQKVMDKKMIFFGVASFEGNAFERTVFDEVELIDEDSETLVNIHKFRRLKNAFPNVKQGSWVEVNFFGEISPLFTFPNKKNLRDVASQIYSYEGNASGIVCTAQGAANFIILTENITKLKTEKKTHVDRKNLDQMFYLIKRNIINPISWFKIDLGVKGLEKLENWDEIKEDSRIKEIQVKYYDYIKAMISDTKSTSYEQILAEDLGKPIDYRHINPKEKEIDLENLLLVINALNEMETTNEAISLLYYPPNVLLASSDSKGIAIGGSMGILTTDVGRNLILSADLRKFLSWGEFYQDQDPEGTDTFDTFHQQDFFELENAEQLRDIYIKTFQKIMQNNQIFLGILELESNAFEVCLFHEINLSNRDTKRLQELFRKKRIEKFPKLKEGHIYLVWSGIGKEYFTQQDALGILDIAEKIQKMEAYKKGYGAGIVCIDNESAYFYILVSNFEKGFSDTVDPGTLMNMFQKIETTNMVPLCWFKITLGMDALKMNPFWKNASQYTSLGLVLDNYNRYLDSLVISKHREEKYRFA